MTVPGHPESQDAPSVVSPAPVSPMEEPASPSGPGATRAAISPGYRWRLGVIALACLLFGAWFLYDGAIRYPHQRIVANKYIELKQKHGEGSVAFNEQWRAYAAAQGVSDGYPGPPKSTTDIVGQFAIAGATMPIGLLFALAYLRSFGRWIACDGAGLTTSWGQRVKFEHIQQLNKERWRNKGIAVVLYREHVGGQERRLVLDDWKYDAPATLTMLKAVEARLKPKQIIGDKSEVEREAERAAAGAEIAAATPAEAAPPGASAPDSRT